MYIYNVTVNVSDDIHDEWLRWMREKHIPDVMKTGLFTENRICRLLEVDDEGTSYSIQYACNSLDDYRRYQAEFAPELRQEHAGKFRDKFVAFRTLLEIVS